MIGELMVYTALAMVNPRMAVVINNGDRCRTVRVEEVRPMQSPQPRRERVQVLTKQHKHKVR